MEKEKIVFFDGVCNLCTASVQFLIKYNKTKNLKFAPLQSIYFQERYPEESKQLDSILFLREGVLYRESTAVLLLSRELIFPLSLFYYFVFIPRFLRDLVYRMIAKRRNFLFGQSDTCYLPTPELQNRFLNWQCHFVRTIMRSIVLFRS